MTFVLVVDEEALVRGALVRALEQAGFECESAASLREAMVALDHHAIDVVLLNASLGDGLGFDVRRAIRVSDALRPAVVFITGRRDLYSDLVRELGPADDWLSKPWDTAELVARVRVASERASCLRLTPAKIRDCVDLDEERVARKA